jgi:hypothetical protein
MCAKKIKNASPVWVDKLGNVGNLRAIGHAIQMTIEKNAPGLNLEQSPFDYRKT